MSKIILYVCLTTFLGLLVAIRLSFQKEVMIPRNQVVAIEATLKTEPRVNDFGQTLKIGDTSVYVDRYSDYHVGDKLRIKGFNDENGKISKPEIEVVSSSQNLLSDIRNKITSNISRLLPAREASLVLGSVLGVDDISKEFKDQLIKTGTIHVVVVSGQNLAIVAGIFIALARYIGRRKSMIMAVSACLFYATLTGFEPPVVRATIMVIASTMAVYFGREANTLISIVLAALAILIFAPQAAGEISFQLTFAATLGIALLGKKLANFWKKAPVLGEAAAVSLSAFVFTAPIIMFYFGRIAVLSPLVNILVTEAVLPIMVLGFGIAITSLILAPLSQMLAILAYVPAFYFVKVVEISSLIPFGQIELGKGNLAIVIVWYGVVLGMMAVWRKENKILISKP